MRMTDLLALSHVPRWSIVRHTPPQNVADHSFRTAVIFYELCERLGLQVTGNDLWAVLTHDAAEARSGDINGLFKQRLSPEGKAALTDAELAASPWLRDRKSISGDVKRRLCKVADLIETFTFALMNGQGRHAKQVADRIGQQLSTYIDEQFRFPDAEVVAARVRMLADRIVGEILAEDGRDIGTTDTDPSYPTRSPS